MYWFAVLDQAVERRQPGRGGSGVHAGWKVAGRHREDDPEDRYLRRGRERRRTGAGGLAVQWRHPVWLWH